MYFGYSGWCSKCFYINFWISDIFTWFKNQIIIERDLVKSYPGLHLPVSPFPCYYFCYFLTHSSGVSYCEYKSVQIHILPPNLFPTSLWYLVYFFYLAFFTYLGDLSLSICRQLSHSFSRTRGPTVWMHYHLFTQHSADGHRWFPVPCCLLQVLLQCVKLSFCTILEHV